MAQLRRNGAEHCSAHGLVLSPHAYLTNNFELPFHGTNLGSITASNNQLEPNKTTHRCRRNLGKHINNPTNSIKQWLPGVENYANLRVVKPIEFDIHAPSQGSSTESLIGEDSLSNLAASTSQDSEITSGQEDRGRVAGRLQCPMPMTATQARKIAKRRSRDNIIRQLANDTLFMNELFEVRRSSLSGLGAFAKQELRKGDVILEEEPLLVSSYRNLSETFEALDKTAKHVALSLSQNENIKSWTPAIERVMMTNAFAVTMDGSASGLFAVAARLNHACRPANNVEFHYRAGCLVMHVEADIIREGDELKISYGPRRSPYQLWMQYGFQCRCGACEGIDDEELRLIDHAEW